MPSLFKQLNIWKSSGIYGFAACLLLVSAATLLCEVLRPFMLPKNFLMIYLLTVVLVALKISLKPAIVATTLCGFIYNFLYVPPRFGFNFLDKEYLTTFIGLLVTGTVISSLVSKLRERAEALQIQEAETSSFYLLSCDLAVAPDTESILQAVLDNVERSFNLQAALFLPKGEQHELTAVSVSNDLALNQQELDVPLWVFQNGRTAGYGTDIYSSARLVYFPLLTLSKTVGVMAIKIAEDSVFTFNQINRLVEVFAVQVAMALERVDLSHQAQQAHILKSRQKLERALLNSVSHDLRSPLATITGVLSTVLEKGSLLSEQVRRELLENAKEEAARLNRFVGKLLDITRLESGSTVLKTELCDVEDLLGCALTAIDSQLKGRSVEVKLAKDLPLVSMDMVLMNQVLINLLDNALKYSPSNGEVEISAFSIDEKLVIQVFDSGPGVPEAELKRIFEKFYRIPVPESVKGTGLGLTICHGIVEAHGGKIWAENMNGQGFAVTLEIPLQASKPVRDNNHE